MMYGNGVKIGNYFLMLCVETPTNFKEQEPYPNL
jgi:hypothetical protein